MKCLQEAEKKRWIIKEGLLHVHYSFISNIHTPALLESDECVYQQKIAGELILTGHAEWDSLNMLLNNDIIFKMLL